MNKVLCTQHCGLEIHIVFFLFNHIYLLCNAFDTHIAHTDSTVVRSALLFYIIGIQFHRTYLITGSLTFYTDDSFF